MLYCEMRFLRRTSIVANVCQKQTNLEIQGRAKPRAIIKLYLMPDMRGIMRPDDFAIIRFDLIIQGRNHREAFRC